MRYVRGRRPPTSSSPAPEYTEEIRESLPLKRWGTPRDVARSVLFLVTSDGDAFTGQTLDPNSGAVMH